MIWHDALTLEPVAPGSCEDGGPPSIDSYYCTNCKKDVKLFMKMYYMLCAECRLILLRG